MESITFTELLAIIGIAIMFAVLFACGITILVEVALMSLDNIEIETTEDEIMADLLDNDSVVGPESEMIICPICGGMCEHRKDCLYSA